MRALSYGRMVVSNGKLYGVVDLDNPYQQYIGCKYIDMVFYQATGEFFVKTSNLTD